MKKPILSATLLGVLAATSWAGNGPPATPTGQGDATTIYRKLTDEFREAYGEYAAKLEELRTSGATAEAAEYEASWNPKGYYVELMAEQAENFAGTEDAVNFLVWLVQNQTGDDSEAPSEAALAALDTLLASHADDPSFKGFVSGGAYLHYYVGPRRTQALLGRVVERSEGELRQTATYARARATFMNDDASEADRKRSREAIASIVEAGGPIAEEAGRMLFEIDNLQIGMIAPDIVGKDLEGVEFKLSDYRGKVVMLDFWGDW